MKIVSPTGLGVRVDQEGSGYYNALRSGGRWHNGVDFLCIPGQPVKSPISGTVVRIARPYANSDMSGVLIENSDIAIKMFYFEPDPDFIGKDVKEGDVIGTAQNVARHYNSEGMKPHIHFEIFRINPLILLEVGEYGNNKI